MLKSKSDQLSVHHKNLGNGFMRNNDHLKALFEYNKVKLGKPNFSLDLIISLKGSNVR